VFLGVLSPYLLTNKSVFHSYFYNPSTTFYVWLDNWQQVKDGPRQAGDRKSYPNLPADQLPGPTKYLRTHSPAKITGRVGKGLIAILQLAYLGTGYFKYIVLYGIAALLLARANPQGVRQWLRENDRAWLAGFIAAYLLSYLLLIAFYAAIATPMRFVLAHFLPLFFVLLYFLSRGPVRETSVKVGSARMNAGDFNRLFMFLFWVELAFFLFPRLFVPVHI
jgi:hypothetical protein